MTPDKKRLMWLLVAIGFFFGNLILATIWVFKRFGG
jgi:hypothetical protein